MRQAIIVILLAVTCFAGDRVYTPRIEFRTYEGLEAQINKILAHVDTVKYLPEIDSTWSAKDSSWTYIYWVRVSGPNDKVIDRQLVTWQVVREPRWTQKPTLEWSRWRYPVSDTAAQRRSWEEMPDSAMTAPGLAILTYREIEK
jgi:hypothetical protein